MARTNVSDIEDIIDTALSSSQITAFMNTANTLVTDQLSGSGLSATLLTEIEKYLSAHLLSLRDQRVESEDVLDASFDYQGETGMHLNATHYGQTVLTLDTTGTLADAGKPAASFSVISEDDIG